MSTIRPVTLPAPGALSTLRRSRREPVRHKHALHSPASMAAAARQTMPAPVAPPRSTTSAKFASEPHELEHGRRCEHRHTAEGVHEQTIDLREGDAGVFDGGDPRLHHDAHVGLALGVTGGLALPPHRRLLHSLASGLPGPAARRALPTTRCRVEQAPDASAPAFGGGRRQGFSTTRALPSRAGPLSR